MGRKTLVQFGLALSLAVVAGCVVGGRGGYYGYSSWDIVRRDPCRYEEYRRFAERHQNPEKRRRFVERLAREGCGLDREGAWDRDRAWDIVRHDPCRYEEYRRFAERHRNPEKRRRFVEGLAREGCSLEEYGDRGY